MSVGQPQWGDDLVLTQGYERIHPWYQEIIRLAENSPSFQKALMCRAKNKTLYLKINTKRGVFFSKQELDMVYCLAGRFSANYGTSTNRVNGTLTIKFPTEELDAVSARLKPQA